MTVAEPAGALAAPSQPAPAEIPKLLHGVSLRHRDLRGEDLSHKEGLEAWALAGSDLRGAMLPPGFEFCLLERSKESAKHCEQVFLVILAAAFSSWLVRLTISDAEMLLPSTQTQLPVLNLGINLYFFYVLSPLLLLLTHVYFHLSLQPLWESVANLPIYFPDGLRIEKKLHPWPLLRVAELLFAQLWNEATLYSKGRVLLTVLLFWGAIPTSLVAIWIHYLSQHDLGMSLWHAGLIAAVTVVDFWCIYRLQKTAVKSLKDGDDYAECTALARYPTQRTDACQLTLAKYLGIAAVTAIVVGAPVYSWAVVDRQFHQPPRFTKASIVGQALPGAVLEGKDLDGLDARRANLCRANLSGSSLRGANFEGANLTGSLLKGADFSGADLRGVSIDLAGGRLLEGRHLLESGASYDRDTRFGSSETSKPVSDIRAEPVKCEPAAMALGARAL